MPGPQPREHGACRVCDHGRAQPGQCLMPGRPVPVAAARSREGHCGPEAQHLCIGGDDLAPRSSPTAACLRAAHRINQLRHGQAA